jgi:membrane dipeptidase
MEECRIEWSRRKFVTTLAGVGGAIILNPFISWANNEIHPGVAGIVARTFGIDTHNHIDVPLISAELPGPSVDLLTDMKKSGLSAICMTFAVDYQKLTRPGEAYDRFICGLDAMDVILKCNNMQRALNLADLKAAHKNHIPSVIQSVEGSHFLEGRVERLDIAYGRGLRHLGLLHDSDASMPLGDVYTNPAKWHGLTSFGKQVVKRCNELGILVDLTHCSDETINSVLSVSTDPIIISHTGLNTRLGNNAEMAGMMKPRLISEKQAEIVAKSGGIIGVWTHLSDTPLEYAQNIRAMVDVIGVDHVCLGTDTKMTTPYRSPTNFNSKPGQVDPKNRKGEPLNKSSNAEKDLANSKKVGRIGERSNEAWKNQEVGFYYAVVDAMLKTGFTEDEIVEIGSKNFFSVFEKATRARPTAISK